MTDLKRVFPGNSQGPELIYYLNTWMAEYHISDNEKTAAAFLSNVYVETGGLTKLTESLWYSEDRLVEVWPHRYANKFGEPNRLALKVAENPEGMGNHTYANRMGNGSVSSGDGFKYRGRGCKMITGKAMYERLMNDPSLNIAYDLVRDPSPVAKDLNLAALSAAWYWNMKDLNRAKDFREIVYKINGGYNGFSQRQSQYERILKLLN